MSKVSALTPAQLKRLKRRVNLNLSVNGNKMRGYFPIYSDGKVQEDSIYFANSKAALQKLAKVEMLTAYSSADGQDSPSVGDVETVKSHTDNLGFKWRGVRLQERAGKWYLFMSYHMNHGLKSTKPIQVKFTRDAPAKVDFGPMAASLSRSDFLVNLSSLLDTEHEIDAAIDSDPRKALAAELYGDADVRLAVCVAAHGELIDDMKPALQARALRGVNELALNANASELFDVVADAITADLEASVVSAAKRPTFEIAKKGIMEYLRKKGWKLKEGLKIPWAESPWGDGTRVWFRKQAIYAGKGRSPADASSTWVDIRNVTPEKFMESVEKQVGEDFNLKHDYR